MGQGKGSPFIAQLATWLAVVSIGVYTYNWVDVEKWGRMIHASLSPEMQQWLKNVDDLTLIQPYWKSMIESYSYFQIVTAGTFVIHECAYFSFWTPYLIMDQIPYFQKFKIQQDKQVSNEKIMKCIKGLIFNHLVIQLPMIMMADFGLSKLGFTLDMPLPKLHTIAWKCGVMFVIEDFYFYWIHRFLHWKKIYKYVHKVHHEFNTPFGIAAEYAHPIETVFLGIGTILGPLFLTRHLFTLWVWLSVRLMETVEDHSGYELPFSPTSFIPFVGGAVHHDHHHKTFDGNYSSVFTVWDRVFGTDKAFRKAQAEARKEGRSSWNDIFDKVNDLSALLFNVDTSIATKKAL